MNMPPPARRITTQKCSQGSGDRPRLLLSGEDYTPFFFVHVPKTGGSSIVSALRRQLGQDNIHEFAGHCPAPSAIFRWGREWFDEHYTFGVVRNPWDRFFSLYNFCMQVHKDPLTPEKDWPFEKWAKAVLVDRVQEVMRIYRNIRPMTTWLYSQGEPVVDDIGRFERLDEAWEMFTARLGIPYLALPKVNATAHVPYLDAYRAHPELVDFVAVFYKSDVEVFNYDLVE